VRTAEEYAAGHAKGAVSKTALTNPGGAGWVPVPGFTSDVKALLAGKTDPILVGCQSGRRSSMACVTLAEAGIASINVEGGFSAWSAAGLPVEK
jgi:rhodanese-related sulfurtransferase